MNGKRERELISALAASDTDNAHALILLKVKALVARFNWTTEEALAVAEAICEVRFEAIKSAFESVEIAQRAHLSECREWRRPL